MRLFHFSDNPDIRCFEPRQVVVPTKRRPEMEWLNGPLVWAIDDWHQPLYLFPRDCPRMVLWAVEGSTTDDREVWLGSSSCRMTAYIEREWSERMHHGNIFRYELPVDNFEPLDDAGMWVARHSVTPVAVDMIEDLPAALAAADVHLSVVDSFDRFSDVWSSTIHASGIRLRNCNADLGQY